MMTARERVEEFLGRMSMYVPPKYACVTSFLCGASWADPSLLPDFQAYVAVRIAGLSPLVWGLSIAQGVLGEETAGAVHCGGGTVPENEVALEALFHALDGYFDCIERNEIDLVREEYEQHLKGRR